MSKVTRDFVVQGDSVTLIDVEAGVEHFGRGIERHVDVVLVVVDPTFESFCIAERVKEFSLAMGISNIWAVLNKVESDEMGQQMIKALEKRIVRVLGTVHKDPEVLRAGLDGTTLGPCYATKEVQLLAGQLEKLIKRSHATVGISL
jgi:CO dehydrogenase maturation factor